MSDNVPSGGGGGGSSGGDDDLEGLMRGETPKNDGRAKRSAPPAGDVTVAVNRTGKGDNNISMSATAAGAIGNDEEDKERTNRPADHAVPIVPSTTAAEATARDDIGLSKKTPINKAKRAAQAGAVAVSGASASSSNNTSNATTSTTNGLSKKTPKAKARAAQAGAVAVSGAQASRGSSTSNAATINTNGLSKKTPKAKARAAQAGVVSRSCANEMTTATSNRVTTTSGIIPRLRGIGKNPPPNQPPQQQQQQHTPEDGLQTEFSESFSAELVEESRHELVEARLIAPIDPVVAEPMQLELPNIDEEKAIKYDPSPMLLQELQLIQRDEAEVLRSHQEADEHLERLCRRHKNKFICLCVTAVGGVVGTILLAILLSSFLQSDNSYLIASLIVLGVMVCCCVGSGRKFTKMFGYCNLLQTKGLMQHISVFCFSCPVCATTVFLPKLSS